ncbi:Clathrin interactor EPSIN 3 [Spatholobus suberectus]|nr:Clathrin interactor EPSIN 3 [Spatholobus suberectus]
MGTTVERGEGGDVEIVMKGDAKQSAAMKIKQLAPIRKEMMALFSLAPKNLRDVRSVVDCDDDGESHYGDDDSEGEETNQNVPQGVTFRYGEAVEFQPDSGVEDADNDVVGVVGVGLEAKGMDQAEESRVQEVWGWRIWLSSTDRMLRWRWRLIRIVIKHKRVLANCNLSLTLAFRFPVSADEFVPLDQVRSPRSGFPTMKKVIGQTVRDLKREVNKKVLKVPGIEQKVLDATSNEPWGPHGSLLADIAQATRNPHEYQMIMAVIWKRINDTGKNWRHVYKALTVLEYLVAHGSERVIDEIREHAYQISTLSDFQYIDSSGRDQGNNVRKKSQSLVVLVNDKERIIEVRQKAAANRDKFRNNAAGGMYRPGSYSSSGAYGQYGDRYDDDRYGSREEDRNGYGYGREREWSYRDDDRQSRDGDRYGRDYEERYGRDGYRDDDYRGRSRSVDYQHDSRSRSSDRDRYDDDGQHSSRGSNAKAEDQSLEARLEQKLSEQNMGAPPSYEEAVGESRSPVHSERDVETSATSAPRDSSPHVNDNLSQTPAPTGSSSVNNNPIEATTAASTAASGAQETEATDDFFDPRGPASAAPAIPAAPAAPATTNNIEMDLLGSLSDSFSSNALSLVPAESATAARDANAGSTASFAAPSSGSNNFNQPFEDPFGESPFKAFTSTETAPSHPQTYQSIEPSQSNGHNAETTSNFGFGDSISVVPYYAPVASDTQPFSTNSQFLSPDLSSPQQETDILADILPPAPLPEMTSQQNMSAPAFGHPSPSFPASSGQMASQPFSEPMGQFTQQGFSAATSQPAQTFPVPTDQLSQQPFSAPNGQPGQVQSSFSSPPSQYAQQPFSSHAGQPGLHAFSSSTGQHMQPPFASQGGQPAQSGGMYGGLHSQDGSTTMSPQSQNGYNGHMNSGNFLPQGSMAAFPSHMAPQAPTGQMSQSTNFPHHGGSTAQTTPHMSSQSPTHQASQFNSQSFIGQGNAAPFSSPITNQSLASNASQHTLSTGSNSLVSQPSKDKFETKSTVWADTLSRGLVNLNISGPKTNPLADIGVDFEAINRKEKRMEKPTTQAVTSTVTMGKAMGSGSGMGRAGAGALRPPPNPMMGSGMGMGNGPGVGMGMGGYGGMNTSMGMGMGMGGMGGMGMGQGFQMQPPTGYSPGSNMPGNYNNSMMGPGSYGQQPYGGYR